LLLALVLLAVLGGAVLAAVLLSRPDQVRVPVVLGQTLPSARAELESAGFKVDIDRRADQSPIDNVFREVPSAGSKVDKGSTVTLFVSNGPTTVKVPDVLGLAEPDARRRMKRANLRPFSERESSRRVPAGNVIRSDPGPGAAIERESRVTLIVSAGPKQVTVPDVKGQDENDGVRRLREANLSVVVRERESSEPVDTILEQTPAAGQLVGEGTSVTLFVSNGKVEKVPDVVGLDQGEAEAELDSAGFRASVRTRSVTVPDQDGTVLSQSPAGGKERRKGESVTITVGAFTPPAQSPSPPSTPGAPG
jgi:serine/threonine-protein kinase